MVDANFHENSLHALKKKKRKKKEKQKTKKSKRTCWYRCNVVTSSYSSSLPSTSSVYSLSSSTGLTCPMRTTSGWRGGRCVGARDSFARRLRAFVSTRGLRHCVCFRLLTNSLVACVHRCACARFP